MCWANEKLHDDVDFAKRNNPEYVNNQNCRVWGWENPHVALQKPMYPLRMTVWYSLWSSIGPYFFENGATITISGDYVLSLRCCDLTQLHYFQ